MPVKANPAVEWPNLVNRKPIFVATVILYGIDFIGDQSLERMDFRFVSSPHNGLAGQTWPSDVLLTTAGHP